MSKATVTTLEEEEPEESNIDELEKEINMGLRAAEEPH